MPASTPAALATFLAEVEQRAFRQARFATQDNDAALDLVQDAMLRLTEHYASRPAAEWPLLFQRILQNAIRDHYRRQKTRSLWLTLFSAFRKQDDEDEDSDPLEWLPYSGELSPSPDTETEQARTMALIEAGLAQLPPRQREAFILRYWEELDTAETAAVMGCSEGSVKTHCSRACSALSAWLARHGVTL
ncbi:RNA polymerase sigma factor [Chitinilyticum piscinae]|uniref:RNA polymerase sigma factor n=1 Tax=Chitinilyticum piscinae TaxID=2866724 RepID=A0A8J7FFH2_9NEIS|nr:RNA polymerase sigma factor [Chitinilyticum piscinae]MBE9608418.1 RNA polymerase sigma factor [Chitinilyticum piscinae]